MSCQYATAIAENANQCGLDLHGGRPSKGVCTRCVERGENNEEFAAAYKLQPQAKPPASPPSLLEMGANLANSVKGWVGSGFAIATPEQLESRKTICKECPEWNPAGFSGTGSCNKCGCSTQAKLRMSTSKCPIDKWGPVDVRQTD